MSLSAEAPSMAVLTNLGSAGQGDSGSTGDGYDPATAESHSSHYLGRRCGMVTGHIKSWQS